MAGGNRCRYAGRVMGHHGGARLVGVHRDQLRRLHEPLMPFPPPWCIYGFEADGGQVQGGSAPKPRDAWVPRGGQSQGGRADQWGSIVLAGQTGGQNQGGTATTWVGYYWSSSGGQAEGGTATTGGGILHPAEGRQSQGG